MFRRGVCIVLGGAGGRGKQCVERCVKCGMNVAFMDINKEAGENLKAKLEQKYGVNVFFFHGDARKEEDRELLEGAAAAMFGKVDFYICGKNSFLLDFKSNASS